MTTANPIHELIRTALADLQPRIDIHRTTIDQAQHTIDAAQAELDDLLAQDAAYRAALPDEDEPSTDTTEDEETEA